jgi:hypothetical protein
MIAFRSLFANNALNMIKVLIDQTKHDNLRILGCTTLVDFIRVQVCQSCLVIILSQKHTIFFVLQCLGSTLLCMNCITEMNYRP